MIIEEKNFLFSRKLIDYEVQKNKKILLLKSKVLTTINYDRKMRFLSFLDTKMVQNMSNYDTIGKWKQASRNERRKRGSYYI